MIPHALFQYGERTLRLLTRSFAAHPPTRPAIHPPAACRTRPDDARTRGEPSRGRQPPRCARVAVQRPPVDSVVAVRALPGTVYQSRIATELRLVRDRWLLHGDRGRSRRASGSTVHSNWGVRFAGLRAATRRTRPQDGCVLNPGQLFRGRNDTRAGLRWRPALVSWCHLRTSFHFHPAPSIQRGMRRSTAPNGPTDNCRTRRYPNTDHAVGQRARGGERAEVRALEVAGTAGRHVRSGEGTLGRASVLQGTIGAAHEEPCTKAAVPAHVSLAPPTVPPRGARRRPRPGWPPRRPRAAWVPRARRAP